METSPDKHKRVLVTDCGSTTTKALLFEKTESGWRQTFRGEAPTTVEEPVADVTVGAMNAFSEVQELSKREILKGDLSDSTNLHPFSVGPNGIDLYLSTSSAGGGLQMIVTGIVKEMSAESAERAALGAGAIVMDTISADDGRLDHHRIERIRHLRPDIVLLTGGIDGGSKSHPEEMAEVILAAAPRPRFGDTLKLPIIYAGNSEAALDVEKILSRAGQVKIVPNVRPTLESENIGPARDAIHEFFLSHVMSHSPGYGKLMSWTPVPVMPTPAAVGDMVQRFAEEEDLQVLCVDIGGATTDVFSVFRKREGGAAFNRTVSANLGMSYSIANVLVEAGIDNICRWLPFEIAPEEVRIRLRNKMIRPTTIPQSLEDLWIEQAVCREALRLSLVHHKMLAVGLSGVTQRRGIAEIFSQRESRYDLVNLMQLDLVIGSGGVLSHAPDRLSALLMMLDGFELQGLTEICVDSIFMMPHLGVFATVNPRAAHEIFHKDCLVRIGHTVVPVFEGASRGDVVASVAWNGTKLSDIQAGEIKRVGNITEGRGTLSVRPSGKWVDVGAGKGQELVKEISIHSEGIVLDGRNRPMMGEQDKKQRIKEQERVFNELGLIKG